MWKTTTIWTASLLIALAFVPGMAAADGGNDARPPLCDVNPTSPFLDWAEDFATECSEKLGQMAIDQCTDIREEIDGGTCDVEE